MAHYLHGAQSKRCAKGSRHFESRPNDEIYTPDDGDRVAEPGERQYWANANFPRPSLMGGDDWRVGTELCDDGVGVTWKPGDWPVGRP